MKLLRDLMCKVNLDNASPCFFQIIGEITSCKIYARFSLTKIIHFRNGFLFEFLKAVLFAKISKMCKVGKQAFHSLNYAAIVMHCCLIVCFSYVVQVSETLQCSGLLLCVVFLQMSKDNNRTL